MRVVDPSISASTPRGARSVDMKRDRKTCWVVRRGDERKKATK